MCLNLVMQNCKVERQMQLEHEPDVDGNIELSGKILYNTDKLIGHMNTEMKHSSLDLKSTVDLKTGMYSKMTYSGVLEILFRDFIRKRL